MNTPPTARRRRARHRAGFTLVEVLVVISIIGVLVALLVPAIASAVGRANEAVVSGDIQSLSQSLASFKNTYGEYPPSRVILSENGFYDVSNNTRLANATDLTYAQLAQRSLRYLRKFFPQASFSTSGPVFIPSPGLTKWHDFNGNGTLDPQPYMLEGSECLVFFLGGIPTQTSSGFGMSGFARSPQTPFLSEPRTVGTLQLGTSNRTASLFEFKNERLVDNDNDGIPGYVDSLGSGDDARFLAYFSGYGGGGYDPNDMNFPETDPDSGTGTVPFARYYRAGGSGGLGGLSSSHRYVYYSPSPNPYTSSPALPDATGSVPLVYINRDSFQLFSAGRDRIYGAGGQYSGSGADTDRLPEQLGTLSPPDSILPSAISLPARSGGRSLERDNISNFSAGRLE
jgi:general secretion pathway protein G